MIKINNITKRFDSEAFKKPVEVLKGVSFELKPASTIGFLGANGAGKTTLMKIIMGFIFQSSGEVSFDQALGRNSLQALKKIGYMPERPYFYPHLKGEDFIRYMGELSEVDKESLEQNTEYWGRRFKIDHALGRELKGYSKGMLQRLGFMAALIHDPEVIILDEPLSGLDPLGRKEFKDVIREIRDKGKTIFFSSHIVSDIEEVCDHVIFLKEGRIVYDGSLQSIYQKGHTSKWEIICQESQQKLDGLRQRGCFENQWEIEVLSKGVLRIVVDPRVKDSSLSFLLNEQVKVIKLSPLGQSLEEVFYFSDQQEKFS